jgi:hypothetical protein
VQNLTAYPFYCRFSLCSHAVHANIFPRVPTITLDPKIRNWNYLSICRPERVIFNGLPKAQDQQQVIRTWASRVKELWVEQFSENYDGFNEDDNDIYEFVSSFVNVRDLRIIDSSEPGSASLEYALDQYLDSSDRKLEVCPQRFFHDVVQASGPSLESIDVYALATSRFRIVGPQGCGSLRSIRALCSDWGWTTQTSVKDFEIGSQLECLIIPPEVFASYDRRSLSIAHAIAGNLDMNLVMSYLPKGLNLDCLFIEDNRLIVPFWAWILRIASHEEAVFELLSKIDVAKSCRQSTTACDYLIETFPPGNAEDYLFKISYLLEKGANIFRPYKNRRGELTTAFETAITIRHPSLSDLVFKHALLRIERDSGLLFSHLKVSQTLATVALNKVHSAWVLLRPLEDVAVLSAAIVDICRMISQADSYEAADPFVDAIELLLDRGGDLNLTMHASGEMSLTFYEATKYRFGAVSRHLKSLGCFCSPLGFRSLVLNYSTLTQFQSVYDVIDLIIEDALQAMDYDSVSKILEAFSEAIFENGKNQPSDAPESIDERKLAHLVSLWHSSSFLSQWEGMSPRCKASFLHLMCVPFPLSLTAEDRQEIVVKLFHADLARKSTFSHKLLSLCSLAVRSSFAFPPIPAAADLVALILKTRTSCTSVEQYAEYGIHLTEYLRWLLPPPYGMSDGNFPSCSTFWHPQKRRVVAMLLECATPDELLDARDQSRPLFFKNTAFVDILRERPDFTSPDARQNILGGSPTLFLRWAVSGGMSYSLRCYLEALTPGELLAIKWADVVAAFMFRLQYPSYHESENIEVALIEKLLLQFGADADLFLPTEPRFR